MRTESSGSRSAFTLVELMVALVVSGFVLLSARVMFDGLARAAEGTEQAAREADRAANADHILRTLFSRLEIGLVGDTTFGGDPRSVHFSTWCQSPLGWLEPCRAVIAFEGLGGTNVLMARFSSSEPGGDTGGPVILARAFHSGEFRYLNDPRFGGHWFLRWGDGIVAPLAAAIVLDGDTSILRIGERS